MRKTIGILAHVDAGKTTLSEAVLYHGKAIRAKGRVDHRDSFLDADAVEKQRGITVFSGQAAFSLGENQYYLVDTPGHADFAGEMERTLGVLDYAVLVVSAADGVQGHTATLWRLLEKNQIPVFFFLNKMDQPGADGEKSLAELREQLSPDIYWFPAEGLEAAAEDLAALDENLLECYLETGYDEKLWYGRTAELIRSRRVFPCFSGSALNDQGVIEFLEQMDRLTKTEYEAKRDEPFCGRVYQVFKGAVRCVNGKGRGRYSGWAAENRRAAALSRPEIPDWKNGGGRVSVRSNRPDGQAGRADRGSSLPSEAGNHSGFNGKGGIRRRSAGENRAGRI